MPTELNKISSLAPPLLTGENIEQKRAEIKVYFNNSWTQYESLFSNINNDEAYYLKPEPLRHPLVFYFGHTATFYINKLILGKYIERRIDPHLEAICAVGVDEMSWDDLDSKNYNWPSMDRLRAYRQSVHQLIEETIDEMPLKLPIGQNSLAWLILMGIEHERIHLETSSVIIRMLNLKYITKQPQWISCQRFNDAPENSYICQPSSSIQLAKPADDQTYGWDNEYGKKMVDVEAFEAAKHLVSNDEFLSFIKAGGYQTPEFWTEEGKQWLAYNKPTLPRFWRQCHNEFFQRNLLEEIPLPLSWPVEVNYLEAKAFCNFKAVQENCHIRLPTEPEWQVMRNAIEEDLPSWHKTPGNINLAYYASSCPVDTFKTGDLYDIIGNVWQWSESPIDGFDGFSVHPLYDDFSTPTFDGKHNLIKGGSWISTGNEALRYSRYAFRRHFFQHAGFRYIRSASSFVPIDDVVAYEKDHKIANEIDLQFSPITPNSETFITQAINFFKSTFPNLSINHALDIGCSVGRTSFELAKMAHHVDGIDLTARNIQHALALKAHKTIRYALPTEGELVEFKETNLRSHQLESLVNKVQFYQGDAQNLKPQFSNYDVIWCQHLIEELYDVSGFLSKIHQRINPQGVLAIASTYQWKSEGNDRKNSIGGFKVNGENFSNLDGLTELLNKQFTLIVAKDFQWFKRVTLRKHVLNLSEFSLWQKK